MASMTYGAKESNLQATKRLKWCRIWAVFCKTQFCLIASIYWFWFVCLSLTHQYLKDFLVFLNPTLVLALVSAWGPENMFGSLVIIPLLYHTYTYICMGSCFFWGGVFFFWSPGPLIACCPGHVVPVISSPYCLVPGALVSWSSRPLVLWSSGPLVPCVFFVFFSNLSFALFHYLF